MLSVQIVITADSLLENTQFHTVFLREYILVPRTVQKSENWEPWEGQQAATEDTKLPQRVAGVLKLSPVRSGAEPWPQMRFWAWKSLRMHLLLLHKHSTTTAHFKIQNPAIPPAQEINYCQ